MDLDGAAQGWGWIGLAIWKRREGAFILSPRLGRGSELRCGIRQKKPQMALGCGRDLGLPLMMGRVSWTCEELIEPHFLICKQV